METSQLQTPRSFFIQEMQTSYSSWKEAFGRELVQNASDAGAKNIHVTMSLEKAVSAFGDVPETDEVIRIIFQDDGCGMSAEVLENVYFRIGESTKRNSETTVGGFGRARLLNFAMNRYRIITQDRVVEGSGSDYVHRTFREMQDLLNAKAATIIAEHPDFVSDEVKRRLDDLSNRAEEMRVLAGKGAFDGCRVEVDIDTKMYGKDNWRNPTLDEMMRELSSYLKTSQLNCRVFVNGEERKERLLKGPARRTLEAKMEDGTVVPFATIHTNKSKSADFSKTMFVRVAGATMFKTEIEADLRVIVEVFPGLSREVLTSNRDGFQKPYLQAYEELKRQLISDIRSALDDRENVHVTHAGGLGRIRAVKPADQVLDVQTPSPRVEDAEPRRPASKSMAGRESRAVSKLETEGYGGVPYGVLRAFFDTIDTYHTTILDGFARDEMRDRVSSAVAGRYGVDRVRTAIDSLTPEELEFTVGLLRSRMAAAEEQERIEAAARLSGLPDVHVHIKGEVQGAVRKAITRNDPRKWDPRTGQGKGARSILTAWTICCESAIQTLLKLHPDTISDDSFAWSPGFIYNAPKAEYVLGMTRSAFMIDAEFVHRKETGERFLLINPIDSDGHLKYRPSEREDLQKLAVLAAHEVSHVGEIYHNESFAMLFTSLMANMDLAGIRQRTNEALKDIRDLYANGRVKVQAMDTERGARPADRLLANLAPAATAAAGILHAFTPEGHATSVADVLSMVKSAGEEGEVEMDFEAALMLEEHLDHDRQHQPMPRW